MMKFFQKLGRSLMLPVSVLPVCGILMGIGYLLCPASMQGGDVTTLAETAGLFLVKAGGAVIDNISWLFVLGVAVGMSDDGHGSSAICGLVSWLMLITLLAPATVGAIRPQAIGDPAVKLAFEKIQNPFIAMVTGIIGAFSYNRFRKTELPDYLAFFSGRRFAVIISALISVAAAVIFSFLWPAAFKGLVWVGKTIQSAGGIGAGIYAFLNRLLIPLGLHHALNNVFWFDTIGIGDLTAFWAGKTSADVGWSLGMYMSGFFAPTMFGIAGAAAALYRTSDSKKAAKGILISSVVCAFVSGVTEPFEFSFMFLCFPLYVIYAALYGIFTVITYYSGFRAGFSFSAGVIDLLFSSSLPAAQKTWMILPLGIAAAIVFYLVFSFFIRRFHVSFPDAGAGNAGSTENGGTEPEKVPEAGGSAGGNDVSAQAAEMIRALGGRSNIRELGCCATRLRLELGDTKKVDQNAVKNAGGIACLLTGDTSCQVIIGPKVQQLCDAMKEAAGETAEEEEAEKTVMPVGAEKAEETEETGRTKGTVMAEMIVTKEGECGTKIIKIPAAGMGTAVGPVFRAGGKAASPKENSQESSAGTKPERDPEEEWRVYTEAVKAAEKKLAASGSGDMKDVLESYAMFLEDPDSTEEAHKAIFEEGASAGEAAEKAGKFGADMLASLNDDYLKSRADDVTAAYDYLIRELGGGETSELTHPAIVLGEALMPTDLSGMDRSDILAIVTGKGSQTSHLAIIARGMGIPYVTCSDRSVMDLADGTTVIVDTDRGEIVIGPDAAAVKEAEEKMAARLTKDREAETDVPDVSLPVKLFANIGDPSELEAVLQSGAEGIGLFRSEFLFLNRDSAPDEEEQFNAYRKVVEGMKGKPVIIRTSDIGADKMPSYMPPLHEENPALGKRAIRISLSEPETFRVQLRALLRAACFGNEKIMYPMITSVRELELLREQLELAARELEERGEKYCIPPCGIMIETPAAAMISDILAQKVDFFSVGTNDLTQYTLALDRQGEGLDMFYDPHHEGILRLIERSAENAHAAGIEIGICGELGADPAMAERFLAAGIDELSMSPASIPRAKRALAEKAAAVAKTRITEETEKNGTPAVSAVTDAPEIGAPADGALIPMEQIPDPVFSGGELGRCVGIFPENGEIYAPCDGVIVSVAATKHAVTLESTEGKQYLIHAGIDTVKLDGKGFTVSVKDGETVQKGKLLMRMDLSVVREAGLSPVVVLAELS